jgi:hypothetical protein
VKRTDRRCKVLSCIKRCLGYAGRITQWAVAASEAHRSVGGAALLCSLSCSIANDRGQNRNPPELNSAARAGSSAVLSACSLRLAAAAIRLRLRLLQYFSLYGLQLQQSKQLQQCRLAANRTRRVSVTVLCYARIGLALSSTPPGLGTFLFSNYWLLLCSSSTSILLACVVRVA